MPGGHEPLELLEPAPTADEVDSLVATRIGNAENRFDYVSREQRHRQARDRIGASRGLGVDLGPERKAKPVSAENHADLVRAARADRLVARLDRVAPSDLAQDLVWGESVQVAQHAVVVENGHLLLWQQHGKKIAVFLGARLGNTQGRAPTGDGRRQYRARAERRQRA